MEKLLKRLDAVTTAMAVALFGVVVLVMSYNVAARFFGGGIPWYMETAQFLNIWMVFIAGVGLCAANDHLRIDAIEGVLKGEPKRWLRLVIGLIITLFYVMMGIGFFILASKSRQQISTMPMFKMSMVYWPIPILSILSAAASLLRSIVDFKATTKGSEAK